MSINKKKSYKVEMLYVKQSSHLNEYMAKNHPRRKYSISAFGRIVWTFSKPTYDIISAYVWGGLAGWDAGYSTIDPQYADQEVE